MSTTFYVYEHWRPDKAACFYVGKGSGRRAYSMSRRNKYHLAVIQKLLRANLTLDVRICASGLSEEAAFALEKQRISYWRSKSVRLVNQTDGGEGQSGRKYSEEERRAVSARTKGLKRSPETRARMSEAFRGRVVSEETRRKIAEALAGRPPPFKGCRHSEETRKKLSEIGRLRGAPKHSPEVIERIAAAHRGKKRSLETCAKISAKAKGRPSWCKGRPSPLRGRSVSAETKEKMAEAARNRWAKVRSNTAVAA